jgi:uncharacterized protein YbjT (DUF2867 family)
MIVITGASGKTGSKAAELLLSKKIHVRVLGRSPEHLKGTSKNTVKRVIRDCLDI